MKRTLVVMIGIWSLIAVLIAGTMVYCTVSGSNVLGGGGFRSPDSYSGDKVLLLDQNYSMNNVSQLDLRFSSDTVDIFPSDDNELRVVHNGVNLEEGETVTVTQSGNTMTVTRPQLSNRYGDFTIFGIRYRRESHVQIYLPKTYHENLEVVISSGLVRVQGDLEVKDLNMRMSSGMMRSDYTLTATESAKVKLTSGLFNFYGLSAPEFELEASSGMLTLENLTGSGNVTLSSGMLKVANAVISDHLDLKASSGSLRVDLADNPSLKFRGEKSSGSISTYFSTTSTDNGKKVSGSVGSDPQIAVTAKVSSGSVRIGDGTGTSYSSDWDWDWEDEFDDIWSDAWDEAMDAIDWDEIWDEVDDAIDQKFSR